MFRGKLLNRPSQLQTVSQGDEIHFVVPKGGQQPARVTEKYFRERPDWIIHPCKNCGLSELFDAPSELMKARFPDLPDDAVVDSFTANCGMCGGAQLIQHKDAVFDIDKFREQVRQMSDEQVKGLRSIYGVLCA